MEVSLYIHLPFCESKCIYCDFLSLRPADSALSPGEYVKLLIREIRLQSRELQAEGCSVSTVYIGGGTPTSLADRELEELLVCCRELLPLNNPEWTVEANPGTVDKAKLSLLSSYGVNRISLGVQDLDSCRLAVLGRTHSPEAAHEAFKLSRKFFKSVSVDLMYGLPGQDVPSFLSSLKRIVAWSPDHISVYGLKTEDGTPLYELVSSGQTELPDDEVQLAMMLGAREVLSAAGYIHYEISNYARPGHLCLHNLTYWQNRPYIGLGLGAHSFWRGKRLENTRDFTQYKDLLLGGCLPVTGELQVSGRESMEDTMILGLRLIDGVSFSSFYERFGCDLRKVFARQVAMLERRGLLEADEKSVHLTASGLPLANTVFSEFVCSES